MEQLLLRTCRVDLRGLRVVRPDGSLVTLSAREAEVLRFLAERPQRTVDRDTLYAEIWGHRNAALSRAVDAMMRRLRTKIEADPSEPDHLLTVHGEGYRFEPGGPAPVASSDETTLVGVGRDPLEVADPSAVARWARLIDAQAATAGGAALGRRGGEALWSFADPALGVAFCLAAVDAGRAIGGRGAAIGGGDRVRLRRMLAAVSPGRVVVGDDLYTEVAMAVGIRDRAWRRLGGVRLALRAAPERVVETGGTPDQPGLRGVEGNLRPPVDRTIGRSSELAAVLERLRHGRLVTVTGTGGVGKTRLSLEVGAAWRVHGGGAWFCDLSACRAARDVEAVVARALAVPVGPGRDLAQALDHLAGDLLVLDNAEQALDGLREVAARWASLEWGPSLLVTSRERLGIAEEEVQELLPLGPEDGIALFAERARSQAVVEGSDPSAVRALVQRLEGLPLAIELAASRSGVVSPVELLARLDRSLSALGSDPSRSERHADLRATVRWSWELLGPLERRVLAGCCAFVGPFETAAAVAVAGDPGDDEEGVIDALHALRRKGLLTSVASGPGSRRLAPYAAVRAFAAEQVGSDALLAVRDRHARWFARWGTTATEDALASAAGEALFARMVADLPELVAAVEHAASRDPEASVGAFLGAAHVLSVYGPLDDIEALARWVLPTGLAPVRVQAARLSEDAPVGVLTEVDRALQAYPDDGRALCARAQVAHRMGDVFEGVDLVEQAIVRLRAVGDEVGLGQAFGTRCVLLARLGRLPDLGEGLLEILALFRRRGDRPGEVRALHWLALVSSRSGLLDRALEEARAAHALAHDLLDPRPRIGATGTLSAIHRLRDEPAPAIRAALATLGEAQRTGSRSGAYTSQVQLAHLACEYQGAAEARRWVAEAKRTARGHPSATESLVDGWLGTAELADGRVSEALEAFGRAIDGMLASEADPFACWFYTLRAVAWLAADDLPAARADLDGAFDLIAKRDPGGSLVCLAMSERAVVRALSGDRTGAAEDLAGAETRSAHLGALAQTKVRVCAALVALALGDREGATGVAVLVRAEVDRRGLGPTTALGARLATLEAALR